MHADHEDQQPEDGPAKEACDAQLLPRGDDGEKDAMIAFTVFGRPAPQGSMKPFWKPGMAYAKVRPDNKRTKPWRQQISGVAAALGVEKFSREIPIVLNLVFYFAKPKSAPKSRTAMTKKPDRDKLAAIKKDLAAVKPQTTAVITNDSMSAGPAPGRN